MVNKVILIGNLGQDPEEPRKTQSGLSVLDISIATKRRGKDGNDATEWHTVTCWNKTAEIAHKYLKKGRQVYIEGRLQYDSWTDESTGKTRKKAKIVAETLQFLGSKNDNLNPNNTSGNAYSKPSNNYNTQSEGVIPF